MHKVKGVEDKNRAAVVYFHGGAVITLDAELAEAVAVKIAIDGDLTVFNVDFRNGPEAKAPKNYLDCYAATKWVIANAAKYNLDPKKISIHGESGGGYLATGVAMHLAKNNESHLVKCVIPDVPMIYAGWLTKPTVEMNGPAAWCKPKHLDGVKLICEDWEKQFASKDPDVFPAEMSEDLLAKLPPHVVMTREFDMFYHDAVYYADRLKKHGKLLELYVQPGACHYNFHGKPLLEDRKKIWRRYCH